LVGWCTIDAQDDTLGDGGMLRFDGKGIRKARNLLRKANGQPPLVEKAKKLPDETIVRRIAPRDDDVMMIPEIDLRAHYDAVFGRPQ
jgi:hypothetical protein